MLSRRGFLGAMAAARVADPERLLWIPGARVISVPAPRVFRSGVEIAAFHRASMVRAAAEYQRDYNRWISAQLEIIYKATRHLHALYDTEFSMPRF